MVHTVSCEERAWEHSGRWHSHSQQHVVLDAHMSGTPNSCLLTLTAHLPVGVCSASAILGEGVTNSHSRSQKKVTARAHCGQARVKRKTPNCSTPVDRYRLIGKRESSGRCISKRSFLRIWTMVPCIDCTSLQSSWGDVGTLY